MQPQNNSKFVPITAVMFNPEDGNIYAQFTDNTGAKINLQRREEFDGNMVNISFYQVAEIPEEAQNATNFPGGARTISEIYNNRNDIYVAKDPNKIPNEFTSKNFIKYDKENLLKPEMKEPLPFAGVTKAAENLGIKDFPTNDKLEKIELGGSGAANLIAQSYLLQKGVRPESISKNSEYTNEILNQFIKNPNDTKLKEKVENQLEDVRSECLEGQKNKSKADDLKNSIPKESNTEERHNKKKGKADDLKNSIPKESKTEERQYTKNGFNVKESTHDLRSEDGTRTVTQKVNFENIGKKGDRITGSGTASVTIGSNGEIKTELTKHTESTSEEKRKDGKTKTRYESSSTSTSYTR